MIRGAAAVSWRAARFAIARQAAIAVLVAACGAAHAAGDLSPAPSAAERCLAPSDPAHATAVYPPDMLEIKRDGRVDARFTFSAADRAPDVSIVHASGPAFEDAVRDYAKGLRVPCMAAGAAPVTISQGFDFVPNDGRKVAFTAPLDLSVDPGAPRYACLVKPAASWATYPAPLLRQGLEGTVVLRVHFTAPDQAPELVVLDDGGSPLFVRAVRGYFSEMRLPCIGKEPVDFHFQYRFLIEGAVNRVVLRDQPLGTFLRSVKPGTMSQVYFDTNLMKCPFDLRLTFLQPWNRNRIDELEEDVPARHAFLDWLSGMQLDLGARAANHVLGQSMIIHVPCVKIDL